MNTGMRRLMGLNSAVTYLAVFAGTTGFGPLYATRGFAFAALTALVLMLIAAVAGSWRSGDRAGLPG